MESADLAHVLVTHEKAARREAVRPLGVAPRAERRPAPVAVPARLEKFAVLPVVELREQDAARPLEQGRHALLDEIRLESGVVVHDQHDVAPRRHARAQDTHSTLQAPAPPPVTLAFENSGPRQVPQDHIGRAVRDTVVDQHEMYMPIRLRTQALYEVLGDRPAVVDRQKNVDSNHYPRFWRK